MGNFRSLFALLLISLECSTAAYLIQRFRSPSELLVASNFLCGIFLEEEYINPTPKGNLERHVTETNTLFLNQVKYQEEVQGFKCEFFKATRSGKMVGFAQLLTDNSPHRKAVIQNLCVSTEYRRLGIGKLMVEQCCLTASTKWSLKDIFLNVEDDNIKAINFYTSLGFRKDTTAADGFGSYMMTKPLLESPSTG